MTREEMLNILHSISFSLIDPASDWEDIGFTEREIWVNAKGYGWILCDEPTQWCQVPGLNAKKWSEIKDKISKGYLRYEDIEGTSLVGLLKEITYGEFCQDYDDPYEHLEELVQIEEKQIDTIFAMDTIEGWRFFTTEEAFKVAYERDWCDTSWDELSDELLACWIERLIDEKILFLSN